MLLLINYTLLLLLTFHMLWLTERNEGRYNFNFFFLYQNKYFVCFFEFFQIHYHYLSSLSFNNKKLPNFRYLVWVFFVYGEPWPVELLNDGLILIFNYYVVFISYKIQLTYTEPFTTVAEESLVDFLVFTWKWKTTSFVLLNLSVHWYM